MLGAETFLYFLFDAMVIYFLRFSVEISWKLKMWKRFFTLKFSENKKKTQNLVLKFLHNFQSVVLLVGVSSFLETNDEFAQK